MGHLNIGDYKIPYEERRSSRTRRITMTILEDRIRVSAPRNVSAKQVKELLYAKQEWILKHWLAARDVQEGQRRKYGDGEHFPYRGYTIELKIKDHPRKTMQVLLDGQVLWVYLPEDLPNEDRALNVRAAMLTWYKAQARRVLTDKLDEHTKRMNVTYNEFRLKEQKTRWGSCSGKGNINLNWRIILAPDEVIDYLIIHELAHLTYLNHSDKFWQRVAMFMPEYPRWKKWLKDHGRELTI